MSEELGFGPGDELSWMNTYFSIGKQIQVLAIGHPADPRRNHPRRDGCEPDHYYCSPSHLATSVPFGLVVFCARVIQVQPRVPVLHFALLHWRLRVSCVAGSHVLHRLLVPQERIVSKEWPLRHERSPGPDVLWLSASCVVQWDARQGRHVRLEVAVHF